MEKNSLSKSLRVQKKNNKKIPDRNRNNGGLLKKVVNYLLSDSYMYAPLVSPAKSPSTGPLGYLKSAISTKKKAKKHVQIREQPVKDGLINHVRTESVDGLQKSPLGRHEKVKHMVHYSTRISNNPSGGTEKDLFSTLKKKPVFNEFVTTRSY